VQAKLRDFWFMSYFLFTDLLRGCHSTGERSNFEQDAELEKVPAEGYPYPG
jgi:hypothetical protein